MPWKVHSVTPLSHGQARVEFHNTADPRDVYETVLEVDDLKRKDVRIGDQVLLRSKPFSDGWVEVWQVLVAERTGGEYVPFYYGDQP